MRKILLMGCGHTKRVEWEICLDKGAYKNIVRLDNNKNCSPDILWDLNKHPLPFKDNEFDEIHAYDVLEHLSKQGDYKFFFEEWSEYWRILKPKGFFIGSVPKVSSVWAFGDPSHTRVIPEQNFNYLDQDFYKDHLETTKCSDFRSLWKRNFKIVHINNERKEVMYFILQKY